MSESITVNLGELNILVPVDGIFSEHFDRRYTTFYNRRPDSVLSALCDQHGSDKGEIASSGHPYPWTSHTYADFIERLFGHCREHVRNVFECGLGTNNPSIPSTMGVTGRPGASLRVWRDYFPNAKIIGADVDGGILFQEERIATFQCDQTDKAQLAQLWAQVGDVQFDLMIDDGLHTHDAGVSLFENSVHRLKAGGIYIIEDVSIPSLVEFAKYFAARPHNYEFVNLYRKTARLMDNSLVVIRN